MLFFNETSVQHESADHSLPAIYTTTGDFYQGNPRSKSTFFAEFLVTGPALKRLRFRFDA